MVNDSEEFDKEFTHDELVQIAHKWLLKRCGFAFYELATEYVESPDNIGFWHEHTVLIECKTSRTDFRADAKKYFRQRPEHGCGEFRFYLAPKGMIKATELPQKWGLIEVDCHGKARKRKGPIGKIFGPVNKRWRFKRNRNAEVSLMYKALRRIHLQGKLPLIYEKYRG